MCQLNDDDDRLLGILIRFSVINLRCDIGKVLISFLFVILKVSRSVSSISVLIIWMTTDTIWSKYFYWTLCAFCGSKRIKLFYAFCNPDYKLNKKLSFEESEREKSRFKEIIIFTDGNKVQYKLLYFHIINFIYLSTVRFLLQ